MDGGQFALSNEALAQLKRDIDAYEAERPALAVRVRGRTLVVMGVYAIVAAIVVWFALPVLMRGVDDFFALATLGVVALAGVGAWFFARSPAYGLQSGFRDRLFPLAFGFVANMKHTVGVKPAFFDALPVELTGMFTEKRFDDGLSGRFDGLDFELTEARLTFEATQSADPVVFNGLILCMGLPTSFAGRLYATRKLGAAAKWFRDAFQANGLSAIESGTPAVDAAYEFRTDNPAAAKALLSGRLDATLAFIGEAWPGDPVRLGIAHGRCFLLLPTVKGRDLFELPCVDERIDFDRHIAPMIADLGRILSIGSLVKQAVES